MRCLRLFMFFMTILTTRLVCAQEVSILNYSINESGQVNLEVNSDTDHYYSLRVRHEVTDEFELTTSLTMGAVGTTIISEPLSGYSLEHYEVIEHEVLSPSDIDNDGQDDITELGNVPSGAPLNYASSISSLDGYLHLGSSEHYSYLSAEGVDVPWAPFLNGKEFMKFAIVDPSSENPQIYFINTNIHERHHWFFEAVGIDYLNGDLIKGEIIYHPQEITDDGVEGVFSFVYSEGFGYPFGVTQKTHELLAANMPFIENNLSYFVTANGINNYLENQELFDASRVKVLFEEDLYSGVNYLSVNPSEGYGLLRAMDLDETPSPRDIVIYESLPNNLPRVGGIITSYIQTPLSHVNLRAIQDNIPNAFIRDPLENDLISELEDKYVHFKVEQDSYVLEESTLQEVNAWHEANRPSQEQLPPLNLSYRSILPLAEVNFDMSDGYGAKCANVATMLTFGFPENTIPDGFGVPFYFYQEFMKFNGFFDRIEQMIEDETFQSDIETRKATLKTLRTDIKESNMPQWMLDQLQEMHDLFPQGISVRVRSSTNNEDLPGFSGAGLYTSKTQHPDEGHISKSIKQVYASMWNLRAFDEREYYRVNHFIASMGALCHPNYSDEKANGVAVSADPIYQSKHTFYLNTQVGEDLVTNPDSSSIPEEILLSEDASTNQGFVVIRRSNQVDGDDLIMTPLYLDQLREFLNTIHNRFAILYNVEGEENFAMDIEYKITSSDQLIIKQARPWSSYWADLTASSNSNELNIAVFPIPTSNYLNFICDCDVQNIRITNLLGQLVIEKSADFTDLNERVLIQSLTQGIYIAQGFNEDGRILFSEKFYKN